MSNRDLSNATSANSFQDQEPEDLRHYYCYILNDSIGLLIPTSNEAKIWYFLLPMGLSMFFDGIAFYYIYNYKGLQAHPMKLFMWMSFFTFAYFWIQFS
jgi:hypothetical protein